MGSAGLGQPLSRLEACKTPLGRGMAAWPPSQAFPTPTLPHPLPHQLPSPTRAPPLPTGLQGLPWPQLCQTWESQVQGQRTVDENVLSGVIKPRLFLFYYT